MWYADMHTEKYDVMILLKKFWAFQHVIVLLVFYCSYKPALFP